MGLVLWIKYMLDVQNTYCCLYCLDSLFAACDRKASFKTNNVGREMPLKTSVCICYSLIPRGNVEVKKVKS